jgi:hypothetical protein
MTSDGRRKHARWFPSRWYALAAGAVPGLAVGITFGMLTGDSFVEALAFAAYCVTVVFVWTAIADWRKKRRSAEPT